MRKFDPTALDTRSPLLLAQMWRANIVALLRLADALKPQSKRRPSRAGRRPKPGLGEPMRYPRASFSEYEFATSVYYLRVPWATEPKAFTQAQL